MKFISRNAQFFLHTKIRDFKISLGHFQLKHGFATIETGSSKKTLSPIAGDGPLKTALQ
jgi:hypothetical protein